MIGLKWRSRRAVQDSSVAAAVAVEKSKIVAGENSNDGDDDSDGCCWERLPTELLREVLMKVEESESNWPSRKHVVACAGVCRSWREMMHELVKVPEISGKITFPISVKQPGPRGSLLRCYIKRNRSTQTYYLYESLSPALADDGKLLLVAQKCRRTTCTDYMISLQADDTLKGSPTYIGKLSNLLGGKFAVYDALPPHGGAKLEKSRSSTTVGLKQVSSTVPVGDHAVAHISYDVNDFGARGPQQIKCILNAIPASAIKPGGEAPPTQMHFPITSLDPYDPFFRSKSNHLDKSSSRHVQNQGDSSLVLQNKPPRWHEQLQCWCLNFHGRVTVKSGKNFQLVASPSNELPGHDEDRVILLFGKVGNDDYTMDYGYPISLLQAFAICLSSFPKKFPRISE